MQRTVVSTYLFCLGASVFTGLLAHANADDIKLVAISISFGVVATVTAFAGVVAAILSGDLDPNE